jgi:hypothetical protein
MSGVSAVAALPDPACFKVRLFAEHSRTFYTAQDLEQHTHSSIGRFLGVRSRRCRDLLAGPRTS